MLAEMPCWMHATRTPRVKHALGRVSSVSVSGGDTVYEGVWQRRHRQHVGWCIVTVAKRSLWRSHKLIFVTSAVSWSRLKRHVEAHVNSLASYRMIDWTKLVAVVAERSSVLSDSSTSTKTSLEDIFCHQPHSEYASQYPPGRVIDDSL